MLVWFGGNMKHFCKRCQAVTEGVKVTKKLDSGRVLQYFKCKNIRKKNLCNKMNPYVELVDWYLYKIGGKKDGNNTSRSK